MPLENAECICIQYLRPFIAIVSRRVTASHDMTELYGHACVCSLFSEDGFCPCFLFKLHDIFIKRLFLCVVCHVQKAETHLAQTCPCHIEVAAFNDFGNQFVRDGFACLIMERKRAQEILFDGVILHELRGEFYEIPPNIGSAETFKPCIGKHSMQRMPEFM